MRGTPWEDRMPQHSAGRARDSRPPGPLGRFVLSEVGRAIQAGNDIIQETTRTRLSVSPPPERTVVIANKFFGLDNIPGSPVVRQADPSCLYFFRHGDPFVSPKGSGINVVLEGSVVPLESSDISRGAARGSVVPYGAHSHILSAARILLRRRPTIPRAL